MICGDVVGPVWKAGGETWICNLSPGHSGDHAVVEANGRISCQWTDDHPDKVLPR